MAAAGPLDQKHVGGMWHPGPQSSIVRPVIDGVANPCSGGAKMMTDLSTGCVEDRERVTLENGMYVVSKPLFYTRILPYFLYVTSFRPNPTGIPNAVNV